MKKRLQIDGIKKIGIKLEELKIQKKNVNTIRGSFIPEKYLNRILRHKKYCDYQVFVFVSLKYINPLCVSIFY